MGWYHRRSRDEAVVFQGETNDCDDYFMNGYG